MSRLASCLPVSIAASALLFASACGDDSSGDTADAAGTIDAANMLPDATPPDAVPRTTTELATDFLGGATAVTGMTGFQLTLSGSRSITNEGTTAGAAAAQTGTFTATVRADLSNDNLRIDYVRQNAFLQTQFTYSEIYAGNLGVINGLDGVFSAVQNQDMLSSRWASGRKQQELLNPHYLVRRILATPSMATDGADVTDGADTFKVIEIQDSVATISLWISPTDGRIDRAKTMVNDPLRRDVELTVTYSDWAETSGIKFPNTVTLALGTDVIQSETRSAVVVNPSFPTSDFDFHGGAAPAYDMSLETFGAKSHQFFQSFSALGIPLDFQQTQITATELSTGVWHLTGGSHHSMAIEQANGVVIVEAPNSPERADAIITWAGIQFPGKAITHVISTHHHQDHSAGLRSFVANGTTVVMHTASRDYFNNQIFPAASTVSPDTQAASPQTATFQVVAAGSPVTLSDTNNTVTAHAMTTTHAGDLLVIHVATSGTNFLFQSDLYNPGNGGSALNPAWAQELQTGIQALSLTVDTLVGGHGGVAPLSELNSFLNP